MADLLECLLQIKALRETADRIRTVVTAAGAPGHAAAAAPLARLAEIEWLHGAWLRLMLTAVAPALPAFDGPAIDALDRYRRSDAERALDRFVVRRRDNLELLDNCSADDLSRIGVHPGRRQVTVADVVALMLATDMEHLGAIRRGML